MTHRCTVIAALLVMALLVPSCGGKDASAPPNVVIVTLDTVRADHVGCYGYGRPTTPRLDAIAAVSTRFTRALSTSSWTVPAHASIFTGRFPFEHGAHAFEVAPGTVNNVNPLPADELSLAEVLWDRGYTTGAFVANEAFLSPRWQINQGFETYHVQRTQGRLLNERVFRWLDAVGDRPFLLFVNYMDAHRPYNTTPRPGVTPRPVVRDNGALLDSLYNVVMPGEDEVPRELVARVTDQYDTGVANADDALGELVERLRRLGVYGRTLLVITSDHGEYLGEHHLVEHSKDIYQEGLMVPLVVKAPGQTDGAVDERVVSLVDVPQLILESFPAEWDDVGARFPDAPGTHDVIAEIYYTRTKDLFDPVWGHRFDRVRTAYFDWPWKLIASSDGDHELFDLDVDAHEQNNRVQSDADVAARLRTALEEFIVTRGRAEGPEELPTLSDEERKRLESLGY